MSAAVGAAGYLYASGKLRGRGGREGAKPKKPEPKVEEIPARIRVAIYQPEREAEASAGKPKRVPRVEYRKRRLISRQ